MLIRVASDMISAVIALISAVALVLLILDLMGIN